MSDPVQSAPTQTSDQGTSGLNPFEVAPPTENTQSQQNATTQQTQPAVTQQTQATTTTQPGQVLPTQQPAQVQPQQQTQPSQQDIASQITAGILAARQAEQQAAVQQQQQAPMSEQEFAQRFGIPSVDAAGYEAMFGAAPATPQALQALNNFSAQTIRSAVLMAEAIVKKELAGITSQISPLTEAHRNQVEERYTQQFYEKYPDLKDEGPLLKEIRDAAKARGMQFNSVDEAFNFAATQARTIIAKIRGGQPAPANGAQQQPQQTAQRPTQTTRTMTPTSMGGRSGSSGSGGTGKSTPELIFGS